MSTPTIAERITELDAILTEARRAWMTAPTEKLKRKARQQIDQALDLRIDLMKVRDNPSPPTS